MAKASLSINIIILIAIGLLVLVLISIVLGGSFRNFGEGAASAKSCSNIGGTCEWLETCSGDAEQRPDILCSQGIDDERPPNTICCFTPTS